jgi:hypothetical protein
VRRADPADQDFFVAFAHAGHFTARRTSACQVSSLAVC